eukprot:2050450-Pleurochrysis_carterae.AAC.2
MPMHIENAMIAACMQAASLAISTQFECKITTRPWSPWPQYAPSNHVPEPSVTRSKMEFSTFMLLSELPRKLAPPKLESLMTEPSKFTLSRVASAPKRTPLSVAHRMLAAEKSISAIQASASKRRRRQVRRAQSSVRQIRVIKSGASQIETSQVGALQVCACQVDTPQVRAGSEIAVWANTGSTDMGSKSCDGWQGGRLTRWGGWGRWRRPRRQRVRLQRR